MKPKYKNSRLTSQIWFLYILECKDGTFYTGITNNLNRRYQQHNEGRGSRYTRTRYPVKLRYLETYANRSEALIREYGVKALSKKEKENLMGPM